MFQSDVRETFCERHAQVRVSHTVIIREAHPDMPAGIYSHGLSGALKQGIWQSLVRVQGTCSAVLDFVNTDWAVSLVAVVRLLGSSGRLKFPQGWPLGSYPNPRMGSNWIMQAMVISLMTAVGEARCLKVKWICYILGH